MREAKENVVDRRPRTETADKNTLRFRRFIHTGTGRDGQYPVQRTFGLTQVLEGEGQKTQAVSQGDEAVVSARPVSGTYDGHVCGLRPFEDALQQRKFHVWRGPTLRATLQRYSLSASAWIRTPRQ